MRQSVDQLFRQTWTRPGSFAVLVRCPPLDAGPDGGGVAGAAGAAASTEDGGAGAASGGAAGAPETAAGAGGPGADVRLTAAQVTPDGLEVTVAVVSDHPALPYRDNLRLLGAAVGAQVLLVGRPDPRRLATVLALAVAPIAGAGGLALPDGWSGRADLGVDRLHHAHLAGGAAPVRPAPSPPGSGGSAAGARRPEPGGGLPAPSGESGPGAVVCESGTGRGGAGAGPYPPAGSPDGDPVLGLLRRQLERIVEGGRAVHALARPEARWLRQAGLETGARLMAQLAVAAGAWDRDVFGRAVSDGGHRFARVWPAAARYEQAAAGAVVAGSWRLGDVDAGGQGDYLKWAPVVAEPAAVCPTWHGDPVRPVAGKSAFWQPQAGCPGPGCGSVVRRKK